MMQNDTNWTKKRLTITFSNNKQKIEVTCAYLYHYKTLLMTTAGCHTPMQQESFAETTAQFVV